MRLTVGFKENYRGTFTVEKLDESTMIDRKPSRF